MDEQQLQAEMKNAAEFLLETLQLVADSKGNPQQVYPVWEQQQAQLNSALLEVLPQTVAQLYEHNTAQRIAIASDLSTFGDLIQQFSLGTHALNMELGITAYELALQVITRDAFPQTWAWTQYYLALAYWNRICGERADNLERAISSYELALQVITRDAFPQAWAKTQNNLAATYLFRIRGERAENLERAITACQNVLQVHTRDTSPQDWAGTQNNLAIAYSDRIHGQRAENLEQAIAACQSALQVYTCDASPEQWARTQNNLANAYSDRIHGERADNLERAIAVNKLALQVYTRDAFPKEWALTQTNLANAYRKRIRGERADNLEQAIAIYQKALQVRTRDAFPPDWALTTMNLAISYSDRIRGERADNLEQAIAAYQKALQVYTCDAFPEQWAMTQTNLALAYRSHIRGERADNLEQAIAACQLALQVYTRDAFPQEWATTQNNLANVYPSRIRGERAENLEQAITACQLALQVYTRDAFPQEWATTQYNLAIAYKNRICGERADNLERAISAYEQALQVRTRDAFPNECRQTARNLGDLHFEQQVWSNAADAYATALSAAEVLYQACILLDGKTAELAATADLPRRAAYALARSGNLSKAAEVLEQGRARGLSETLDRDRANLNQLQQAAPELYEQYQDITHQLRNLESQQREQVVSSDRHNLTPEAHRSLAIRLRQNLDTLIAQIRQVEGYADFLDQPNFDDIHTALQPDRPLVYLVPTLAGSLALIITPEGIADLWLNDLTETSLIDLLNNTWLKAYSQSQTDRQSWFDAINAVTRQLWEPLMQPLIYHLNDQQFYQATLISTGFLSLLPLHVAWTEDPRTPTGRRYALDNIRFTYTPNARSLSAAQDIAQRIGVNSMLAIDNPTQDLPNSEREVNTAITSFPKCTVLRHTAATIAAVRSQLSEAAIAHFSCHGTADLQTPLNSGLLMHDGLLTLKDIFALNLAESGGLRLAILSACETGMIGIENADEAISLPTGLLQAGVAAVIASLWAVPELSTMLLLVKFYDNWRNQNQDISEALCQAQQWLRDTTNQEKSRYFAQQAGKTIPQVVAEYLEVRMDLEIPDERTFAHPYHWAAFGYTGV